MVEVVMVVVMGGVVMGGSGDGWGGDGGGGDGGGSDGWGGDGGVVMVGCKEFSCVQSLCLVPTTCRAVSIGRTMPRCWWGGDTSSRSGHGVHSLIHILLIDR